MQSTKICKYYKKKYLQSFSQCIDSFLRSVDTLFNLVRVLVKKKAPDKTEAFFLFVKQLLN